MLLIEFQCTIDCKYNKNEKVIKKVKILYFIVKRDKRENVINNFDCKVISI